MPSTNNKRQLVAEDERDDDFEIKKPRRSPKVVSFKHPPKRMKRVPPRVSPSKPKKTPKTHSVSTQTRRNEDNYIHVNNTVSIKKEFPVGSIVAISGRDLDYGRYKVRKHAPTFYGVVEPHANYSFEGSSPVEEGWTYVTFVVSGEYECTTKMR